jgi:hypothetical protein
MLELLLLVPVMIVVLAYYALQFHQHHTKQNALFQKRIHSE